MSIFGKNRIPIWQDQLIFAYVDHLFTFKHLSFNAKTRTKSSTYVIYKIPKNINVEYHLNMYLLIPPQFYWWEGCSILFFMKRPIYWKRLTKFQVKA